MRRLLREGLPTRRRRYTDRAGQPCVPRGDDDLGGQELDRLRSSPDPAAGWPWPGPSAPPGVASIPCWASWRRRRSRRPGEGRAPWRTIPTRRTHGAAAHAGRAHGAGRGARRDRRHRAAGVEHWTARWRSRPTARVRLHSSHHHKFGDRRRSTCGPHLEPELDTVVGYKILRGGPHDQRQPAPRIDRLLIDRCFEAPAGGDHAARLARRSGEQMQRPARRPRSRPARRGRSATASSC